MLDTALTLGITAMAITLVRMAIALRWLKAWGVAGWLLLGIFAFESIRFSMLAVLSWLILVLYLIDRWELLN